MQSMKERGAACMLCLSLLLSGCTGEAEQPSVPLSQSEAPGLQTSLSDPALPQLTITVMNLGKADSILIQVGEQSMLIDTGEDEDGSKVLAVLEDRGIRRLDCLLLTHLDKDHIGGADQVIKGMEIGRLIQSHNSEDSGDYAEYEAVCQEKGISPERLTQRETLVMGGAMVQLLPAEDRFFEDDNDYSIMAEMTYGEKRFLFAGDAENQRLAAYLKDTPSPFDFLKVPHHGRKSDLSAAFFEAVRPTYAVITCSKKKGPDEIVLSLLAQNGAQVFLTSQGYVTALCDGRSLTVYQDK